MSDEETMVERVAKALHEKLCEQDVTGYLDAKIDCGELAMAVIEEMREPSSWMMNEAVQIYEDQKGNVAGFEYWHRMIDAALAEPAREAAIDAALKEHEGEKR